MYKAFSHPPLHKDHMALRTAKLSQDVDGDGTIDGGKFGPVRRNANGTWRNHQGIDLAVDNGYRCYAVEDGVVATVAKSTSYGNTVTLKVEVIKEDGTTQNLWIFYAHLSRVDVKQGQKINAGQVIGLSGSTGNAAGMTVIAKGSHLHLEVRVNSVVNSGLSGRIDPWPFVSPYFKD